MEDQVPASRARSPKDMVWIPAGEFLMGSGDFYPEERPVHQRAVEGFWMDQHPVTVAEFRRFVKATGHLTVAEQAPDAVDFPDADPDLLVPGSLVFTPPPGPVSLDDFRAWWAWTPGAQWRHPEGPDSGLHGLDRHPVTHVAYADALAYAEWADKELPSEVEWEYAARGRLEGATYAWGDEFTPRGRLMANMARRVPASQRSTGRSPAHLTGGQVPSQRLWARRHHRQRVGVDPVAVHTGPRAGVSRAGDTARSPGHRDRARLLRAEPAHGVGRAGDQGRLPPVCAELLPSIPAGGSAAPDGGHLDQPPGLPLHPA